MSSILVINAAGRETRVALVENGHIAEFYLERKKDRGVVGNIYKGRVVRVLPGMQAAFVDIGLEKAAFLYVSDVVYDPDFARAQFELTEGEHDDAGEVPDEHELHDHAAAHPEEASASQAASPAERAQEPELEVRELAPGELSPPSDLEPVRRVTTEMPAIVLAVSDAPEAPVTQRIPTGEHPVVASPAPVGEAPAQTPGATEPLAAETTEAPSAESAAGEPSDTPPSVATPEQTETATSEAASSEAKASSETTAEAKPEEVTGALENRERSRSGREAREKRDDKREDPRGEKREKRDDKRGKDRDRGERGRHEERPRKEQRIEDLLKVGQEVVVQISKDPIGTKGARLTSHISIPGRHLVFMPTVDHVGISRRIGNEKERRRLRDIVDKLRPPGTGFIVRTVAENVPQEKLESDIRFLIEIWNQVVRRNEKRGGPGLMHPDLDLILRATRDLFAQDVEKLVVDDRDEYERILQFVNAQDPGLKDRVLLHDNEEPIFDAYGIEQEIERATQRKVWLKSGGYLIMDQAEALTAIDVNSGRYVGKKSLEETITKINMEAAKEIVYQLRLRNIGGIIICDFIDMEKSQNRDKVFKTLQEALGRDKAKTNVLRISELGLVEMTRKRVRESIGRVLHEDCAYCDGQGFVKTTTTVAYEIFRDVRRETPNFKDPTLVINCSNEVARLLQADERDELRHLMDRYNKSIQVKAQPSYHREQYDLYARTAQGSDHKVAASHGRRLEGAEPLPPPPARPQEGRRDRRPEREGREGKEGRGDRKDRGRDRGERPNREGGQNDRGRADRQGGQRQGGERQGGERQGGERQGGERQGGERQRGDRPRGERQDRGDRQPNGERPGSGEQAATAATAAPAKDNGGAPSTSDQETALKPPA